MKILYTLSNPGDRLNYERAGHIVRANAILRGLEKLGHQVFRVEAGEVKQTKAAVSTYRSLIKKRLPRPLVLILRDMGRIVHGHRHAQRLIAGIKQYKPDLILETHLALNLAGKIASETTSVPLVVDDLAPVWEEEQQYGVGLKKKAGQIYGQVVDRAAKLVAVNTVIKRYLIGENVPENKICVVENGIDEEFFHFGIDGHKQRRNYGFREDEVVIVFVGSFQPYHRVDILLKAFAEIKSALTTRLLLVGDGVNLSRSKSVADTLGLGNRVVFTGRIPYDEVSSFMAAGDIAVMPATNEYGNPMKIYEYLALGKVVVAPNQETITEIVEHKRDAYLFERENISSLTYALENLVEDPSTRAQLGMAALQTAKKHTWSMRANAMEETFRSIDP